MNTCPTCYELLIEEKYCPNCDIWIVPNSEFRDATSNCLFCIEGSVATLQGLVSVISNDLQDEESSGKKLVHPLIESIREPTDERTIAWVLGSCGAIALFLVPTWNAGGYIVAILLIVAGVWAGLENSKKLDAAKLHNQYVSGATSVVAEINTFLKTKSICLSCDRLQLSDGPTFDVYWEEQLLGVKGIVRNTANNKLVYHDGWLAAREFGFG